MAKIEATPEQVRAAREWVADCSWKDSDDVPEYSDRTIVQGVQRHYDGGWSGFVSDVVN